MRKYARWPGLRTALEHSRATYREQSGRAGAVTGEGVMEPSDASDADECFS